ncbi:glycerophosphodiester phosphodiesterase [Kurthia populi]|uniref:Glycerophosphodiester phosphodiesterase n=1 Tax=Kurthia populi TaxID=1562132 RepID=A0ABW5Y5V4_9BACL
MKKSLIGTMVAVAATIIFTGEASAAKHSQWLQSNKTELSAHRGAQIIAPENTVEAIAAAGKLRYGFVEIDVQRTKDHHYILMHDKTVDRTTNGSGQVSNMTLAEIEKLKIEDDTGHLTSYKVPTLQEALEEADRYDVGINFDGSKGNWDDKDFVDDVIQLAQQENVYNHSFFVLSNTEIREQFNKWYPEAPVTSLGNALKNVDTDLIALKKYNQALYSVSINNINAETAEKIKRAKLKLHVYGVNTEAQYEKAQKLHPRLIETDVIIP